MTRADHYPDDERFGDPVDDVLEAVDVLRIRDEVIAHQATPLTGANK